ncbi:MAG: ABC transporter ATP-binding protein/permease [Eubacteriales bacterium]|nr:ABC transporter ATP-binding protein/permease [Eubacteriales bacterium]
MAGPNSGPNYTKAVDKAADPQKVLRRLWGYLYRYKWQVLLAFLLMLASNLFALVGPLLSGYAIDAIGIEKGKVDFAGVFYNCALMIAFYIASSGLAYILSRMMIDLSQKVVAKMRSDVFNRLTDMPVSYFDTHQTGEIISHITYDIDTVNASLSTDLLQILASAVTVIGSLVMMVQISPILLLVFVVTVPLSFILTKYITGKIRPLFKARSAKLGELNGYVEESLTGQKTITAYNRQEVMLERFDEKNREAVNAYYNADYYGSINGPCVNLINNLSLALISVFGAIMYLYGSLTLGNLSSFVLYSRKFSGPINEAANILGELQSAFAAAERVFRIIDAPLEPADAENAQPLTDVEGHVEVEHVDFGYSSERLIVEDLNIDALAGKMVAIVGPTGAGKTTIINLLMRFYDPSAGFISIDGREIRSVTRESLRLSYAMVLQDTWLFQGTVYENIAYGKKDATREEVVAAAKAAKIHNFIMQLPQGYDTILNDEGLNISQGQKQLLTIARAMLPRSKILILDEATSNVDTRTEMQIQSAMRKLMRGKTCFIIAHRLSTIQNADIILVLSGGKIAERGSHEELLAKKGLYYDLYAAQFS